MQTSVAEINKADIASTRPKPFVKWVGGKRQLIPQFKKLGILPPSGFDIENNTYHEPFVGGGAVFFEMLPRNAVLSDMNRELVTTYNIIKTDVEGLISELLSDYYLYDKERFLEIRAKDVNKLSELEVAARFIYLNRTAFNGMYRVNRSGHFNVPFGRYTDPTICDKSNLRAVAKALKDVEILNQDYKRVLDTAKTGDFIYFDPPYYPVSKTASFTSYTTDGFLEKQQEELRDTFIELHRKGCFVALSNSDTPFMKKLFERDINEGTSVVKVQAGRSINSNPSKRGGVHELVITNHV